MADNIPELEPCPKCRGRSEIRVHEVDGHGGERYLVKRVQCRECGLQTEGTWASDSDKVEAWNTRAAPKVKPLEVEERRYHKLGLGPYELCPNGPDKDGSGMWRVRYHGKVICKQIKGVERAIEWVQRHHRERILSALQ